jgi:glycosyltransferase involved in cell wall biosynthesis
MLIETDEKPDSYKLFPESDLQIWMIIPAYNEEKFVGKVLKDLFNLGLNLIVIDDGSRDNTYQIVLDIIKNHPGRGYIYQHPINRGLGATLKTGIEAALNKNADIMVTFDADGQHNPEDILPVCRPIIEGRADVVIGIRDSNQIMNLITRIFYNANVKDSQSGLRAFNNKAAKALDIESREYGVSSEIIREIKHKNLRMEEVPIETIYTDYSLSKGTNAKIGFKILVKMIREILK